MYHTNRTFFNIIISTYEDNVSLKVEICYNGYPNKESYRIKDFDYAIIIHTTILDEEFVKEIDNLTFTGTYTELLNSARRVTRELCVQEYHKRLTNIYYPRFYENLAIKPSRYDFNLGTLWYDRYNIRFSLDSGILFKGNKVLGEIKRNITNPLFMIKKLEKLIKQEAIETWKSELRYKVGIEKYETNK